MPCLATQRFDRRRVRTLGELPFISPAHDELGVLIRREALPPPALLVRSGFSMCDLIGVTLWQIAKRAIRQLENITLVCKEAG